MDRDEFKIRNCLVQLQKGNIKGAVCILCLSELVGIEVSGSHVICIVLDSHSLTRSRA